MYVSVESDTGSNSTTGICTPGQPAVNGEADDDESSADCTS